MVASGNGMGRPCSRQNVSGFVADDEVSVMTDTSTELILTSELSVHRSLDVVEQLLNWLALMRRQQVTGLAIVIIAIAMTVVSAAPTNDVGSGRLRHAHQVETTALATNLREPGRIEMRGSKC